MSLVVKYPERTEIIPTLIGVAREELEHFDQVYELMRAARGAHWSRTSRIPT